MRGFLLCLLCTNAFAADPKPPELRLPADARPLKYTAELTMVPTEEPFGARIEIDLEVLRAPLSLLWLNATELTLSRAEAVVGGATVGARVISTERDFVGLAFEKPLPKGRARVRIEYRGKLSAKDASGAMRQKEG